MASPDWVLVGNTVASTPELGYVCAFASRSISADVADNAARITFICALTARCPR